MPNKFYKTPAGRLDYLFNWETWLNSGDTISSNVISAVAGILVNSISFTNTTVTVWVASGTAKGVYPVTSTITTALGRTTSRTFDLFVLERRDA